MKPQNRTEVKIGCAPNTSSKVSPAINAGTSPGNWRHLSLLLLFCLLATAAHAQKPARQVIKDPFRLIDGKTNTIGGKDWYQFNGVVKQVHAPGMLRIEGRFFPPGEFDLHYAKSEFFITHFPYDLADGDSIGYTTNVYLVKAAGTYTYKTVLGGPRTLHQFIYGQPVAPAAPRALTAAEKKAQEEKAAQLKAAAAEKALAWNRAQAEKGDTYAQFRMGERYLNGEGVAMDPQQARAWFAKAALQGHAQAASKLADLTASTASGAATPPPQK